MCKFASFFHKPGTDEVAVYNLGSHSDTESALALDKAIWSEGHYLPDGTLLARVSPYSNFSQKECEAVIRARFPTFIDFLNWAFIQKIDTDGLDLSGLTSAQGLKLPSTVGGGLDLRGLTSAQGLKLPSTVKGWLYLRGLTSAELAKLNLSKEFEAKLIR